MKRLLLFTAQWCKPCHAMVTVVCTAAKLRGLTVHIIDVEQEPEMTQKYMVLGTPTLIIEDGDKQDRIAKSLDLDGVLKFIDCF